MEGGEWGVSSGGISAPGIMDEAYDVIVLGTGLTVSPPGASALLLSRFPPPAPFTSLHHPSADASLQHRNN